MNTMMRGLEAEGVQIKDFMQEDGSAKTGASLVAAMAGNRVKKFNMKDSIVDDLGRSVDFAMSDDGSIGKMTIDGVKSTSEGRVKNYNRDIQASMTAFNTLHQGNKDMQVGLDERGNYTGTPEAIKAFDKHYEHKQHAEAAAKGIIGEFGATIMDAASSITNEEIAELGMLGIVGTVAGKKMLWDPIDPLGTRSKKQNSNDFNNDSKDANAEKSDPKTHNMSPKERYESANSQINESRTNLSNYNEELSQLQEKNKGLMGQIDGAMKNPKYSDSQRTNIIEAATSK